MIPRRKILIVVAAAFLSGCGPRTEPGRKLTVAAAANLTDVFAEVGKGFTAKTGVDVVFSYGATAQLAQQIENGAPFDVFAAADTEHVTKLIAAGKLTRHSQAVYALGQLALWIPNQGTVKELKGLDKKEIRFIAIAKPELAPYGQASIEALKAAGIWSAVESRVVYGNSISAAKQLAASRNADAAFTAYSLVLHEAGTVLKVDPSLYRPIEQALGIIASSPRMEDAKKFRAFLLGSEGRALLAKSGYLLPVEGR